MNQLSNNQIWLNECGTKVIQKKFAREPEALSNWERLVYNVWYTKFMLKTLGGIDEERCAHPSFRKEANTIASNLELQFTADTYRMSIKDLNKHFEKRLEGICAELRAARRTSYSLSEYNTQFLINPDQTKRVETNQST